MSKAHVIVLSVVHQGFSNAEAARRDGVSGRWARVDLTGQHQYSAAQGVVTTP